MSQFLPTWQGEAVNWEIDELGHLNMRHYMTKAQQARQMFMMQMGLVHAFEKGTSSTVRVREFHIRYAREALPGAALRIETGITRLGNDDMALLHVMYHKDGSIAATIHEQLEHVYLLTHRTFDWPDRLLEKAKPYVMATPEYAKPKGLADVKMTGANLDTIENWGCHIIGRGVFQNWETGNSNTVCAQNILGRLSESIRHYEYGWPEGISTGPVMGVLLEIRHRIHNFAAAGEPFIICSGIEYADEKIRRLIHHIVNPVTGRPFGSYIAVNAMIDLDKRKLALPSDETLKTLQKRVIPNLHA